MTLNYGGTWRVKLEAPSVVPLSDRTGWWYKVLVRDKRRIIVWQSKLERLAQARTQVIELTSHLKDGYRVSLELFYCHFGETPVTRQISVPYAVNHRVVRSLRPTTYLIRIEVQVPALVHTPAMKRVRRFVRRAMTVRRNFKYRGVKVRTSRPSPEVRSGLWATETENWISGHYSYGSSPNTLETYRRTWTGVRTPGYGNKKKGSLPNNPHSVTIALTFPGSNSTLATFKPVTGYPYADVQRYHSSMKNHYAFTATLGFDNSVYNRAVSKIIARAGASLEANLAQDFAQFGQLTSLVTKTCLRLTKGLRELRRGNIAEAAKVLWGPRKAVYGQKAPSLKLSLADNWLEFQYAWKPLLQDIQGNMDSLAAYVAASRMIQLVTASTKMDRVDNQSIMLWAYPNERAGSSRTTDHQTVKIGLRYSLDDRLAAFLAQTGFTNPLNLAWEILPFSFVADWFLPVGPYLEALSAWNGLTFVDGYTVKFQRLIQTLAVGYGGKPIGSGASLVNYEDSGSGLKVQVSLVRGVLNDFPMMRPPHLKNGLSIVHSLNALALLMTGFRDPRYQRPLN